MKEFEVIVVDRLLGSDFSAELLEDVKTNASLSSYEWTSGGGYFLTLKHDRLPVDRRVFSRPTLIGEVDEIVSGFVVFVEDKELTLECHSWGGMDVPENYRDRNVEIREP